MSRKWYLVLAVAVCLPAGWWIIQRQHRGALNAVPPTEGISQALAVERKRAISSLRYDLTLVVPGRLEDPIQGRETIRLQLAYATPLVIDFAQPQHAVTSVKANGRDVPVTSEYGHRSFPGAVGRARTP